VAGEVNVEDIGPVLLFGGAGFDFREVDVEVVEGLEGFDEGAGLVFDGEEKGGAVVTGGGAGFFSDDEKAGGVGGLILDGRFDEGEVIHLGGKGATKGGGSIGGAFFGELGGFGGGGAVDEGGVGEVFEDPLTALAEDLGVGVEGFDFLTRDGGDEAVFNAEKDLGADFEGGFDEEVKGVGDGAFGGVLDGDDAVVGFAAEDLVEDFGEIRKGGVINGVPEFFDGGLVGPSALRAEVGDSEVVF